jgi:hypothetical protein
MALLKHVWNVVLGSPGPEAGATTELSVVREDRNPEILFSVVETNGAVRRRLTFSLSSGQAINLARFLAGVSIQPGGGEDEDLTPTKPGRAVPEGLE